MTNDEDLISLAQGRYAADCGRFRKHVFETSAEIITLNGLRAVALSRNGRLTAAYRVVGGAVDDLAGTDLARVRELLRRRKAQSE
jgi:hypothetical protein